jgi:hypothetical protein
MKTKLFTILVIIILSTGFIYSQVGLNKTAQSTMNFLLVGTSPRACALGEAFTTVGSGAESIFYNPAGITKLNKNFDITINYTSWIADIDYYSGGIAWNMGLFGVLGFHLLTVNYGSINGTSLLAPGEENLYSLGYKETGIVNNVGAYSLGISYGKAVSNEFSIGGTVKYAGQNLGENIYSSGAKENNASKLVFDAGVKYQTEFNDFAFGMSIRNFSTNLKREEIDEQLPLLFSLGAAINVLKVIDARLAEDNSLIWAVDFLHPNNYSERTNVGLEFRTMNLLSVRFGYQTNRDLASWSGGLGVNTSFSDYDVIVNYSYSKFEFFTSVSRLSLSFSF